MFTGIIQGMATAAEVEKKPGLTRFVLDMPEGFAQGVKHGASIAVDGCCLTAAEIEGDEITFDAMDETLRLTTIGNVEEGTVVNVERSFSAGDEIGGHIVSGHVTGKAKIVQVETPENNHVITFQIAPAQMKYVFPKGFIALDGASLTVVDVDKEAGTFTVWLIPETLKLTTFGFKKAGDEVNFEIDSRTQTIVDTIEHVMRELLKPKASGKGTELGDIVQNVLEERGVVK